MSIINGCDDVKTILRVGQGFGGDTEICFQVHDFNGGGKQALPVEACKDLLFDY